MGRAGRSTDPEPIDVLIIADRGDVHAGVVVRRLEAMGASALILSTADYLREWDASLSWIGGAEHSLVRARGTGRAFHLGNLRGAWYRRFLPLRVSETMEDEEARTFALCECRDFLQGLIATCPNVINDPAREWAANRKLLQLHCAMAVGLRVPDTLVGTDPGEAAEFDKNNPDGSIFKILTSTDFQFTETRRLSVAHLALSEAIAAGPTIFQQRIDARHHLRATYVDGRIFTARLTPRQAFAGDDWRLDPTREVAATELDAATGRKVCSLMRALGLRFGALDFIVDGKGQPWFLEVNPGGQFLFCEIHAELPISETLAKALLGGNAPRTEAGKATTATVTADAPLAG